MGHDETPDPTEFYFLQDAVELLATIVQPAAYLLNPLVRLICLSCTEVAQRGGLICQIGSLPRARYSRIHNGFALALSDQPAIGKILVVCVVPPIGQAAMRRQGAFAVPLLQRLYAPPNQLAESPWRIGVLHTHIIVYTHTYSQAIPYSVVSVVAPPTCARMVSLNVV